MRKTWTLRLGAIFLVALLAVPATIAAPQQQTQQQSGQQTSQQSGTQPAQQTNGQPASQDGPQQPAAAAAPPQGEQPLQQPADPNVKQGGKQDVNAIGNRNVGHGLNFYSLEHEIATLIGSS